MLMSTIAAFCIIDDFLPLMGHKDDPQTKVPSSVILTLAILAALHFKGNHSEALAFARDFHLFSRLLFGGSTPWPPISSPSCLSWPGSGRSSARPRATP
ncbi:MULTISPECIES: hypothetical protein [unclassified Meiothermus]|uniref:hypothetical protein n=1 Tax=unclassified Meiothermus TaxID=370471 RepID=UPI001F1782F7|nr:MULTISPECIES: hypothetical protein [unclassified Meiothermus]